MVGVRTIGPMGCGIALNVFAFVERPIDAAPVRSAHDCRSFDPLRRVETQFGPDRSRTRESNRGSSTVGSSRAATLPICRTFARCTERGKFADSEDGRVSRAFAGGLTLGVGRVRSRRI